MAERSSSPRPTQRRYPPELRERAVRMVREVAARRVRAGILPSAGRAHRGRLNPIVGVSTKPRTVQAVNVNESRPSGSRRSCRVLVVTLQHGAPAQHA